MPRHHADAAHIRRNRSPDFMNQQYMQSTEDRSMFSHQYTRQLSTSPPPFSYAPAPVTESLSYGSYPQHTAVYSLPVSGADMQLFPSYLPPIQQSYSSCMSSLTPPIKQEYYGDEETSPFSMSYATMAGIDVQASHAYHDPAQYVSAPHRQRHAQSGSFTRYSKNLG